MGLVDDDGEFAGAVLVADGIEDKGELLDGRDDDAFALLEEGAEVGGALGMADDGADLGELSDCVANLPVEDLRSVTTMTESKRVASSRCRPMSWWASQAIELDLPLPAECWMRYLAPTPRADAWARSLRTTSSWW